LVDISGKEQNVEELDEDEKYNRQYMVSEIDQNIEERATKLIKQLQTEVERRDEETSDILQEQNKLAEQIAEADGEAPEFLDED
jgi:DNA-binding ferritin-like protein